MTTIIVALIVAALVYLATRFSYKRKLNQAKIESNEIVRIERSVWYDKGWRDADSHRNNHERIMNEVNAALKA